LLFVQKLVYSLKFVANQIGFEEEEKRLREIGGGELLLK